MRQGIDAADDKIVAALAERFAICRRIGDYKRAHGQPVNQPPRVLEVKARAERLAASLGLAPDDIGAIYDVVIDQASRLESTVERDKKSTEGGRDRANWGP
jgi:4-amino-4-deoxychorismate mutase